MTNVWLNVINSELKKLDRADPQTKLAAIGSKMTTLARAYASSEQFFPLEFVVKTLETYSIRWSGDPGWVTSILLSAGVPFQRIFTTYNKLHQAKDPLWQVMRGSHNMKSYNLKSAFVTCVFLFLRLKEDQITYCKCSQICSTGWLTRPVLWFQQLIEGQ